MAVYRFVVYLMNQGFYQQFASLLGVLQHRGQAWRNEPGHWNIIKAHYGYVIGHEPAAGLDRAHGADCNQITGTEHGIDKRTAFKQLAHGLETGLFGSDGINL